ncbi:MAG: HpcH/HpaI aldolase family protein [Bryobacteraceae bacterium]
MSPLKAKMRETPVLGTFCELPCRESVEIATLAGWDYVVIDCEHAPISNAMLPDFVRAAGSRGLPAIIRVPENNAAAIQQALDSGAGGVLIPQVSSLEAAQRAISASRFHPLGSRGLNPFVRAASYSAMPAADFIRQANEEALVILQIESAGGLKDLDAIVSLPGLDIVFIGPYDLSQSLGMPGDVAHERVIEAGAEIIAKSAARGVQAGVFVNSLEAADQWLALGIRFLAYSADIVQLTRALKDANSRLKEATSHHRFERR